MLCGATVNPVKSSAAVPLPWPCSSFETVHLWVSHSVKLNNFRRQFTSCAVASASSSSVSSSSTKKKVLIPIGYGTEEMEAVIMAGVLRTAGAEVTIASVEPETLQVELSGGMRMVADTYINCCSDETFDLVALPGGMPGSARLRDCNVLKKITSRQAEEKRLYSAISAAPAVTLLPWGLLKRKKATCHPAFMDKLPTFWAVKSSTQVSGELTTSRGPGTSFEFALTSVEHLYSDTVAKDVRDALLLRGAKDHPRSTEYNEEDWTFNQIPTVLVPVGNGLVEIEVVSVVDILRRANVNVVVASVEKSLQLSACQGTKIIADQLIGTAAKSTFDVIILPGEGSDSDRLQRSRALKKLLKEQKISSRVYGAMGSSLTLLQKQGLVKGKRVAAYPSIVEENVVVVDEAGVVIDGKVITSKGFSSVTDFALSIVGKLFGQTRARSVAEGLVFDYPRR